MNKEEAAHIVDVAFNVPQAVRRIGEDKTYHEDEIREAKNMAIKALEQIPDLKEAYNKGYKDGQDALAVHLELCKEEQEPCEDCISREPFTDSTICEGISCNECSFNRKDKGGCILEERVMKLPSIQPKQKTGHCKEWKYFEYDSVARVDGIPLIVAHEICKKWGDGCKTSEDGYCFLFEPKMSEIPTGSEKE